MPALVRQPYSVTEHSNEGSIECSPERCRQRPNDRGAGRRGGEHHQQTHGWSAVLSLGAPAWGAAVYMG